MKACGGKIPPAVIRSWQQQAETSRSSFSSCMRNLAGSGGRGGGRFRGRPGGDFRSAYLICRSLVQGDQGGSAPQKAPPKPVAPVA